jgi:hypothetical protein
MSTYQVWNNDHDYIVNVAENLAGKRSFNAMAILTRDIPAPALHTSFAQLFEPKVREMNAETLGRICEYASPFGVHDGPVTSSAPKFINNTGFRDLEISSFSDVSKSLCGREILEEVAIATLCCVSYDIIRQGEWQANWASELDMNHKVERGEHAMIHPERHRQ